HSEKCEHFVDLHRLALIERVKETEAILDRLLEKSMISDEVYGEVRRLETTQKKMREILKHVTAAGNQAKSIFMEILKGIPALKLLMDELSGLH
uniref:CARD domain-containing protein n=1 Tax=Poecilia reticulata TaxID=8081 RepID=A0A3P9Q839_POERE